MLKMLATIIISALLYGFVSCKDPPSPKYNVLTHEMTFHDKHYYKKLFEKYNISYTDNIPGIKNDFPLKIKIWRNTERLKDQAINTHRLNKTNKHGSNYPLESKAFNRLFRHDSQDEPHQQHKQQSPSFRYHDEQHLNTQQHHTIKRINLYPKNKNNHPSRKHDHGKNSEYYNDDSNKHERITHSKENLFKYSNYYKKMNVRPKSYTWDPRRPHRTNSHQSTPYSERQYDQYNVKISPENKVDIEHTKYSTNKWRHENRNIHGSDNHPQDNQNNYNAHENYAIKTEIHSETQDGYLLDITCKSDSIEKKSTEADVIIVGIVRKMFSSQDNKNVHKNHRKNKKYQMRYNDNYYKNYLRNKRSKVSIFVPDKSRYRYYLNHTTVDNNNYYINNYKKENNNNINNKNIKNNNINNKININIKNNYDPRYNVTWNINRKTNEHIKKQTNNQTHVKILFNSENRIKNRVENTTKNDDDFVPYYKNEVYTSIHRRKYPQRRKRNHVNYYRTYYKYLNKQNLRGGSQSKENKEHDLKAAKNSDKYRMKTNFQNTVQNATQKSKRHAPSQPDVVVVEVKRILKGISRLNIDPSLHHMYNTGLFPHHNNPKKYIRIQGVNNHALCNNLINVDDTRIFSLKSSYPNFILSHNPDRISTSNIQMFIDHIKEDVVIRPTLPPYTNLPPWWARTDHIYPTTTSSHHRTTHRPYVPRTTTKTKEIFKSTKKTTTTTPLKTTTSTSTTTTTTTIRTTKTATTTSVYIPSHTVLPMNLEARTSVHIVGKPTKQVVGKNGSAVFVCKAVAVGLLSKNYRATINPPDDLVPQIEWLINFNIRASDSRDDNIQVWEKSFSRNELTSVLRLQNDLKSSNIQCTASVVKWYKYSDGNWRSSRKLVQKKEITRLIVEQDITSVRGFPRIKISPPDGQLKVLYGSQAELKCDAYARPYPSIAWFKEGIQPIYNNSDHRYLVQSGDLIIREVMDEDSGLYECRANNSYGTNVVSLNLHVVKEPCKILNCHHGAVCVSKGQEASCECQIDCSDTRQMHVCSKEGITYPSLCHVKQLECLEQRNIDIKSAGRCKTKAKCPECTHGSSCVETIEGEASCQCNFNCEIEETEELCGSDGQTYMNRCHLSKTICLKRQDISIHSTGPCDPCQGVICNHGATCQPVSDGSVQCLCVFDCSRDTSGEVCAGGRTYSSRCELEKQSCFANEDLPHYLEGPCVVDPCSEIECTHGSKCVLTEEGIASCQCVFECEIEETAKVCGFDGQTYMNTCYFNKAMCESRKDMYIVKEGPCDPCEDVTCLYGSTCVADWRGFSECQCIFKCPSEEFGKVCAEDGKTYENKCVLETMACENRTETLRWSDGPCKKDPCLEMECTHGSSCVVTEGSASCQCLFQCDPADKVKVCGLDGITYENMCHFNKMICENRIHSFIAKEGSCDPCEDVTCFYGSTCVGNSFGFAECQCIFECPAESYGKVCAENGQTYENKCEIEKLACESKTEVLKWREGPCDPCSEIECTHGSKCMANEEGTVSCHCVFDCEAEATEKLCGSDGQTYMNRCHLNKMSCLKREDVDIVRLGSCDLCDDVICHHGSTCVINSHGQPECQCLFSCPQDPSLQICADDGRTYASKCELEKLSCLSRTSVPASTQGPCKTDPCKGVECTHGASCVETNEGEASCQCVFNCEAEATEKICGSDGKNYINRCQFNKTICENQHYIEIVYAGDCDPCLEHKCESHQSCVIDAHRVPSCGCPGGCDSKPDPVCGNDGVTYANECLMKQYKCLRGMRIEPFTAGECVEDHPCVTIQCKPNEVCETDAENKASCSCGPECPKVYSPVCGDDGHTYNNYCSMRRENCLRQHHHFVHHYDHGICGSQPACKSLGCAWDKECVWINGLSSCQCPQCTPYFKPVCGKDKNNYINECYLRKSACEQDITIEIEHQGLCDLCRAVTCYRPYETCDKKTGTCQCPDNCDSTKGPVCASNGLTYPSLCDMQISSCLANNNYTVVHEGECDGCLTTVCYYGSVCKQGKCICDFNCTVPEDDYEYYDPYSYTDGEENEFVCGADRKTYTRCQLKEAVCKKQASIEILNDGRCDEENPDEEEGDYDEEEDDDGEEGGEEKEEKDDVEEEDDGDYDEYEDYGESGDYEDYEDEEKEEGEEKETDEDDKENDYKDYDEEYVDENDTEDYPSGYDENGEYPEEYKYWKDNSVEGYDNDDYDDNVEYDDEEEEELNKNPSNGVVKVKRTGIECNEETCMYGGRCGRDVNGRFACLCHFDCPVVRSPVCGSDQQIYTNECELNKKACTHQRSIYPTSMSNCNGVFEEFCDNSASLLDPNTQQPVHCHVDKPCPAPWYCHVIGSQGKCCLKAGNSLCTVSKYGCCADKITESPSADQRGCPENCRCNRLGSVNATCDPSSSRCYCKAGVVGVHCDRCDSNYWGMHRIGQYSDGCTACHCNKYGSLRMDCDQMTGKCLCLTGVTGSKCDTCSNGKKLNKKGCVDDRNRRSKPCPADIACKYGATCHMTPSGPECICPESCSQAEGQIFEGVICGTDNRMYASKCQLEMAACRHQMDIKVLSYGPCLESKMFDTPVKKVHRSESYSGDEIAHVYPSFYKKSWMKIKKSHFGSNDMTLKLEFKPSKKDGIIFYLGYELENVNDFFALVLHGGHVEIRYNLGFKDSVLKSTEQVKTGFWHTVQVSKFGRVVLLAVDHQLPDSRREIGSLASLNLLNTAFLGAPPNQISRKRAGVEHGFQGCIKSFIINSTILEVDYRLHEFTASTDVIRTHKIGKCKQSACSKFPCEHGGLCYDVNEGLSFKCQCKPGFTGTNCQSEQPLFYRH